ncbi:MAG: hypothetical protein HYW27_04240 [Candidatus Aenigmarchaeota archaeon]|nr:hypothetical protein [Candidatus Aenigmarchaeota archaeon]
MEKMKIKKIQRIINPMPYRSAAAAAAPFLAALFAFLFAIFHTSKTMISAAAVLRSHTGTARA